MSNEKYAANNNLKELHSSGYEIADGEPDIRGWKARTAQHEDIGKVEDLLFDTVSLRVRYIVIDLNGKPMNLVSRKVIIPIGLAELDEKDNVVFFPDVTVGHLASLPDYKKGKVIIEIERAIRTVFASRKNAGIDAVAYKDVDFNDPDQFYNHEDFDEERMYRSRGKFGGVGDDPVMKTPGDAGRRQRIIPSGRANKSVEERKVEEADIPNQRTPGSTFQEGSFAPFQEGAIEITEHSEVPVISKEARVVEEVSVNKEVKERNEKVKDSVRKTEIDVEKLKKDDLSNDD